MKQKDIALIAIIVFISAIVSFFVSGMIFGTPSTRQEQVEIVQPITADFPAPDPKYFNESAIDPTRPITIGDQSNSNPFNGTTN